MLILSHDFLCDILYWYFCIVLYFALLHLWKKDNISFFSNKHFLIIKTWEDKKKLKLFLLLEGQYGITDKGEYNSFHKYNTKFKV